MASRFSLAILLTLFTFSPVQSHYDEDNPAIKTMEEFSGYPFLESQFPTRSFSVDTRNLEKQIDELSHFSDSPTPSVTRILYSEKDVLARRYIKSLMELSGLSIREDVVGNIFGRWDGSEPDLPAVSTGSHIDAIPYSGKYDGVVGVLGAIEAINVLKRSGFKPKRSLEVIMFTSEEPTRFGISCLGSRLLAGIDSLAKALEHTVDNHNISFLEAARSAGYANHNDISSVFLEEGTYSAFVELHIEQGPILEDEGIPIGIVTAIAAPASIRISFEGNGGHAGAVLMPYRYFWSSRSLCTNCCTNFLIYPDHIDWSINLNILELSDGLSLREYSISCYGARKGVVALADIRRPNKLGFLYYWSNHFGANRLLMMRMMSIKRMKPCITKHKIDFQRTLLFSE